MYGRPLNETGCIWVVLALVFLGPPMFFYVIPFVLETYIDYVDFGINVLGIKKRTFLLTFYSVLFPLLVMMFICILVGIYCEKIEKKYERK